EWMRESLVLDVPHRQVVFTIPKMLRIYFKYNRSLLSGLCLCGVDSENTQLLPQRVKSCSVSGFALLSIMERNHARFAFKRFFSPTTLRLCVKKSDGGMALKI
ncbi:MAG: hypothetical protein WBC20_10895, partial [Candidatus Aminicenantaceae bacterium]